MKLSLKSQCGEWTTRVSMAAGPRTGRPERSPLGVSFPYPSSVPVGLVLRQIFPPFQIDPSEPRGDEQGQGGAHSSKVRDLSRRRHWRPMTSSSCFATGDLGSLGSMIL